MAATNSHGFAFTDYPATRMAWPGGFSGVANSTGGTSTMAITAPFIGLVDVAMAFMRDEFARRGKKLDDFSAFEKIEWVHAHREAWLVYQAWEGTIAALERTGNAQQEAGLAKMSISLLTESIMTRLCKITGGSVFGRHSPLGHWFEDARALAFLRPPPSLAHDTVFAMSELGEPGAVRLGSRG